MASAPAIDALRQRFSDLKIEPRPMCVYLDGRESGQFIVTIPAGRLLEVAKFLLSDPRCRFEQLSDVTCVDYLNYPEADWIEGRFGVTYSLLSISLNQRFWLRVFVSDPNPTVPSLTSVWKGAEWTEREVFDMFGVRFTGHPDLRRILMPDEFQDHPLRKDYPLRGKGEREAFPVLTRDSA